MEAELSAELASGLTPADLVAPLCAVREVLGPIDLVGVDPVVAA